MTSNFIRRYIPALGKCSLGSLYMNVHSNIIHDSQKAEATHTSKNCVWVNCVFVQATTQS